MAKNGKEAADSDAGRLAVHVKPRAKAVVTLRLDAEIAEQIWLACVNRKKILVGEQKKLAGMRIDKAAKELQRLVDRFEGSDGTGLIRDLTPQGDLELGDEEDAQQAAAI